MIIINYLNDFNTLNQFYLGDFLLLFLIFASLLLFWRFEKPQDRPKIAIPIKITTYAILAYFGMSLAVNQKILNSYSP